MGSPRNDGKAVISPAVTALSEVVGSVLSMASTSSSCSLRATRAVSGSIIVAMELVVGVLERCKP